MNHKLRIPYTEINQYCLVECFLNYSKRFCIVNLEQDITYLNTTYFRSSIHQHNVPAITLNKFNCYFIKKQNTSFNLTNLTNYEIYGKMIHGVLGKDLFEGYEFERKDTRTNCLVFSPKENIAS